ncbi:hypothetical protein D3C77_49080 [compost metagenome]
MDMKSIQAQSARAERLLLAYRQLVDCAEQENCELVMVEDGVQSAVNVCHGLAARSGWWTSRLTGKPLDLTQVNIGEKLMLIVSEVAEAMEGDRKDLMDDKLPHRKMLEVELADALIRIFDLAGFLQLDLAGAVIEKLAFNQQRPDHKLENRNAPGGKAY